MALEIVDLRALIMAVQTVDHRSAKSMLFLGQPHLYFDWKEVESVAQALGLEDLTIPSVPISPTALGRALGFELVQTAGIEGGTDIHLDLTEPLPAHLAGNFDVVVDAGVLYWCMEPGIALQNMCILVAKSGATVHVTSLAGFLGRGYYSIQPRLFFDYYNSLGAELIHASWRPRPRTGWQGILGKLLPSAKKRAKLGLNATRFGLDSYYWGRDRCFERPTLHSKVCVRGTRTLPNDMLGTFAFSLPQEFTVEKVHLREGDIS